MVRSYRRRGGPDPLPSRLIAMLAALGVTPAAIAILAGVKPEVLEEHFGEAMRVGACLVRAAIVTKMFEAAIGGNAAAIRFLDRRTRVPPRDADRGG
jgi:hypothetical protein